MAKARSASTTRKTKETEITVELRIDGNGDADISTPVPFFGHMLELAAKHGLLDLKVRAQGDIEVDAHHTVEDVGITLGESLKKALGDKKGIVRYGSAVVPMNESLAEVSVDLSGRAHLVYNVDLPRDKVGEFDVELTEEFFRSFATSSASTLHITLRYGTNVHHSIEAIFKAFGRALDAATSFDERVKGVPSTKGTLE
jgi:imidazoleglycerol-phosphate dehydratase